MKILFLTLYPEIMPSSRYRVYQFLPYLRSQGVYFDVYPALPQRMFRYLYNSGNFMDNISYTISEIGNRVYHLLRSKNYDVIFIQKGLTTINLRSLPLLLKKKVIFDVDDNVFNYPISEFSSAFLRKFQDRNQAVYLAIISKAVITGNKFLQNLTFQYNKKAYLVPTSVDTNRFLPRINNSGKNKKITIGWIGSPSTSNYLNLLLQVFKKLLQKYQLDIRIIGDAKFKMEGLNLSTESWNYIEEVNQLQKFDIGVMPMPDNEWTRGKCGLKALQYMAVGIPAVASTVGANNEIIQDGINGFLANTEEEWEKKLSLLIENQDLRRKLGQSGRSTVEEKYSLKVNAPRLLDVLKKVGDRGFY